MRVAVRVTPAALAVIVTEVEAVTALVVIAKVALVVPCAIDTPAGTDAAALLYGRIEREYVAVDAADPRAPRGIYERTTTASGPAD